MIKKNLDDEFNGKRFLHTKYWYNNYRNESFCVRNCKDDDLALFTENYIRIPLLKSSELYIVVRHPLIHNYYVNLLIPKFVCVNSKSPVNKKSKVS